MLIPYPGNLCSAAAEKMLSIKINNRCNRTCSFCVDRGGRMGETIAVDRIAAEAMARAEYQTVIVTGGEPFLDFADVLKLVTALRPYKKRVVLNTNGTLLAPERVLQLNGKIDEIQVSIHNPDEDRHGAIIGGKVSFDTIAGALANRAFMFSINSTFNNSYGREERPEAIEKMVALASTMGADRLRLTELKKVDEAEFVPACDFALGDEFSSRTSINLITRGCTKYSKSKGVSVSVKRLCEYARGKNAPAFSCCFINAIGQKKIDVDTKDTFKVIYSDGMVADDWIFTGI